MKHQRVYLVVLMIFMALGLVNIASAEWGKLITYAFVIINYALLKEYKEELFGFVKREEYWTMGKGIYIPRRASIKVFGFIHIGGTFAVWYFSSLLGDARYIGNAMSTFMISLAYVVTILEIMYLWQDGEYDEDAAKAFMLSRQQR